MKKRLIALVSLLLIVVLLFAGCSENKGDYATNEMSYPQSASSYDMAGGSDGGYYDTPMEGEMEYESVDGVTTDPVGQLNGGAGLKIIYTAYLSVQTKEFQESYDKLLALVEENGGYLQSSNVSGGYTSTTGYYYNRYADLSLRIPAENYKTFLQATESVGTVTDMSESTDDITSTYIDTEARLKTLKAQEERLLELLAEANEMTDLIAIESKLADVRYQIESYQSQMNTYDNLLSYSTITVSLQEVSDIVTPKDTFGQRIVAALKGSFEAVVDFFDGFVIVLIYALPFIAIALVVLFIVLRATKKKRAANRAMRKQLREKQKSDATMNSPYASSIGIIGAPDDEKATKKKEKDDGDNKNE